MTAPPLPMICLLSDNAKWSQCLLISSLGSYKPFEPRQIYFDALVIKYLYSSYGRQPDHHESNENLQVQIHCIFDGSVPKTKNRLCSPNLIRAALLRR
jgi:hypothetical protein